MPFQKRFLVDKRPVHLYFGCGSKIEMAVVELFVKHIHDKLNFFIKLYIYPISLGFMI